MPRTKNEKLSKVVPALLILVALIVLGFILSFFLDGADIALLDPKGVIANDQHSLLINSTLIMLAFAVPVMVALYFFAWKYRESNQKTTYTPDAKVGKAFLLFAWGGPLVIVIILASLMIPATFRLAPQEPIETDKDQMTIQVVALNWKWLFIYPEHDVATVNFAQIPVDTPVRFELTADGAPMSSFWIPHLGGMLYSMTGHVNPLNLMADTTGDYPGSSAELNGYGFAGMKFTTRVSTQEDFDAWVADTKQSPIALSEDEYAKLLEPSMNNEPVFYASPNPDLYSTIVSKYSGAHEHGSEHEGHGNY